MVDRHDPEHIARREDYAELYGEAIARHHRELHELHYVMSHDLQEPLRKITGFVDLLQRRYQGRLDEDADEYIGFIVDACERMHHILGDLLSISRVETRGAPFEAVSMAGLLDEVIAEVRERAGMDDLEVRMPTALPVVRGDRQQLRAIVGELIDNAIKFHGDGPVRLAVSAEREQDGWHFRVEDDGIGIDPAYAERIFGIFQRLHTREEYPGTGIGLALCRKIVERHGGGIWVEPAPEAGSVFHFRLPGADDETREETSNHVEG
jgi:light-regulated signal transduction histidine kinase (bacteriophytochrome)